MCSWQRNTNSAVKEMSILGLFVGGVRTVGRSLLPRQLVIPARRVHEVPTHTHAITEMIDKLGNGLPEAKTVRAAARNTLDGKISARFYTNNWPEFSTVVAQMTTPRLSEVADLICYSTSAEGLLHVLKEADLITWGKWQRIEMVDTAHAGYLVKELTSPSERGSLECLPEKVMYNFPYIPSSTDIAEMSHKIDMSCPKGFRLGKLEPQHAPLVVSYWRHYVDRPISIRTAYYEHLLKHFESVAIFSTQDPTTPVAWVTEQPYGCFGSVTTIEKYRKRGFLNLVAGKMLVKWYERGQTPLAHEITPGSTVAKQCERFGGHEITTKICLIVQ